MTKKQLRGLTLGGFVVIAAAHYVAQFVAWAIHPGNRAHPEVHAGWVASHAWAVLSFPLFAVLPGDDYFGLVLAANSSIWGILGALAIGGAVRRRSPAT